MSAGDQSKKENNDIIEVRGTTCYQPYAAAAAFISN